LREIDRRLLARWLAEYQEQHRRYDALWKELDEPPVPELFEVSFGHELHGEDPVSTEEALELSAGGRAVRISGRVDRIDTGTIAGQAVFNVIDYKTGGATHPTAEAIARGTALQLPLYAFAVAELLLVERNPLPWKAGYWRLRKEGFMPRQSLSMYRPAGGGVTPDPQWERIRWNLPETVVALAEGIRQGEFPVFSADERCTGYCPFRTVCRINQIRSLEKKWQPAADMD
jgi:ATP-dependent helicase/DNAse subunit B